jgi:uncharacterized membrane protein YbhN (UPF0104 family)
VTTVATTAPAWRRWLPLAARILVPALFLLWWFKFADREAFLEAIAHIPPAAMLPALALALGNMLIGAFRWRLLMRALGARELPTLATATRVLFVGLFYNTFVPGSIGGDVVRGVVSRRNFDNPLASYVVVLLERLIGLSALGVVFLAGVAWGPPLVDIRALLPWIGGLVALGVVIAVAAVASGRFGRLWRQIPRFERPADLLAIFGISFVGHGLTIAMFYLLSRGMDLPLTLADLAFVVPLGLVAGVLPVAIAGVGPREAALVALLRLLGIPSARGLALSLAFWALGLVLALLGGLIQLVSGRISTSSE